MSWSGRANRIYGLFSILFISECFVSDHASRVSFLLRIFHIARGAGGGWGKRIKWYSFLLFWSLLWDNVVNNYTEGRGRGGPDYPDVGPPDVLSTILGITSFCVILTIFVYRPPPFSFRSNLLFQWPSSRNLSPVMVCLCPPNIRSSIFFILFILLLLVCLYSSFLLLFFLSSSLLFFFYFLAFLPFLFFVILLYSFSFFLSFFYCHF